MKGFADVEESFGRQGVGLLTEDAHHLGCLVEQTLQRSLVVRESHRLHPLASHGGETSAAHLLAHQVETYLMFVVLWVYQEDLLFTI